MSLRRWLDSPHGVLMRPRSRFSGIDASTSRRAVSTSRQDVSTSRQDPILGVEQFNKCEERYRRQSDLGLEQLLRAQKKRRSSAVIDAKVSMHRTQQGAGGQPVLVDLPKQNPMEPPKFGSVDGVPFELDDFELTDSSAASQVVEVTVTYV